MEKLNNNFEFILANKNKTCLIILGPTGIGKTKVSLALASLLNTEIINTDAFSFYKNAEIMTAKASKEEKQIVKHHLIDFLDINDLDFSVSNFQNYFDDSVCSFFEKQKVPVIVGGSNYYVDYILFDKRLNILNINQSAKESIGDNHINDKATQQAQDKIEQSKKETSLFVSKENFMLIIKNLKDFIEKKFCKNSDQNLTENFNKDKAKKPENDKLSEAEILDFSLKILDEIEKSFSKTLEKYNERINCSEFLGFAEVTKTENLLFEALNEILDYSKFSSLIPKEKDYSFFLHNLIEQIDLNSFNFLHKNNLRKIINVLMYYFVYGKAKSQLLESQSETLKLNNKENDHIRFENSIIIYLKFLNYQSFQKRVSSRIDQMLFEQNGLEEVFIIFEYFRLLEKSKNGNFDELINDDNDFDFTRGILQAIGYKEFYEFYVLLKQVFLDFIQKAGIQIKNENKILLEDLIYFWGLFDINKIELKYLLEQNENDETCNKYSFQIILIIFVFYFKRKYLFKQSFPTNKKEIEIETQLIKQISEFFNFQIAGEKIKELVEKFKTCKYFLIKKTLKYAKSQIKFIEKRLLPNLSKNFSKENHNLLKYDIEEFKEDIYKKIIKEIEENVKNKIPKDEEIIEKKIEDDLENVEINVNEIKELKMKIKKDWKKFTCDVCDFIELNGEAEYKSHLESNKHKKRKRKVNKIKLEKESIVNENKEANGI